MRHLLALLLVTCGLAGTARAATLEGVTMPDTYTVEGKPLVLNGLGLRTLTIFSVRVYVAGLYLQTQSHDAAQIMKSTTPKVIRLQFLHSGSKADIEKEYRAGEEVNCGGGGCNPADRNDFERLIAAAPAVKVGDTSTYVFTAKGVTVLANDRPLVVLNNPSLAFRLLDGFLGAHPPSVALKNGMLGLPPG